MKTILPVLLLTAAISLSACGNTQGERALSGAGIGAATGAVGTALVGGHVIAGTAIGAGVGAIAGAVTDESEIDLD